ncbi:MAG: phosphate acyltransferase PlsX, partial [Planctomycetales bacterium]
EGMVDYVLQTAAEAVAGALEQEHEQENAKKAFYNLADRYHHSSEGGAPLLGIDGTCIICHGSSDARSICNALLKATQHNDTHLNELIVAALEQEPSKVVAD